MRYVPVEEARRQLGKLVREAVDGTPVMIGRHGTEHAVLVSEEEYERLRRAEEDAARARFGRSLQEIGEAILAAGIAPSVVDEAIEVTRKDRRRDAQPTA